MRRLRHDEQGFSLIELLVSMLVGTIVLFAVLGLLDTSTRSAAQSAGRTQAVREGRTTMDRVGQELRLASCPDSGTAILTATDTTVSFYVTRPQADYRQGYVTERHTLDFDPSTGRLRLTVVPGSGTPVVWSATPTRTEEIGSDLALLPGAPFFRYRAYTTAGDSATAPLATPVTAPADLASIAQVEVAYNALPSFGDAALAGSRFDGTVVLRTDDPTDQDNTPEC